MVIHDFLGGSRSGQPSAVSTSGTVAAGSRPGLSIVQVHYQAFEVQQTEAISLRTAYVSHLSMIPVRAWVVGGGGGGGAW